jgi:hypothetical protein
MVRETMELPTVLMEPHENCRQISSGWVEQRKVKKSCRSGWPALSSSVFRQQNEGAPIL